MKAKGFTLIELLIVVAIIAILAAIAVPNFIEAQVRAKVARAKADMRTMTTALEAYCVDWNGYPFDGANYTGPHPLGWYNYWYIPKEVSTPVAYVTSVVFTDPFRQQVATAQDTWQVNNYRYQNFDSTYGPKFDQIGTSGPAFLAVWPQYTANFGSWHLNSSGPDRTYGERVMGTATTASTWPGLQGLILPVPYDPTNGTVSPGDIVRSQKSSTSGYANAQ